MCCHSYNKGIEIQILKFETKGKCYICESCHKLLSLSRYQLILLLSLKKIQNCIMEDIKYLFLCKHDFPQYFLKFSDVVLQISESTHWSNANGDFKLHKQNLNNIIYLLTKTRYHICQFVYILHLHLDRCIIYRQIWPIKSITILIYPAIKPIILTARCVPIMIPLSDNANDVYQLDNYWRWKTWHFELGQLYLTPRIIPLQTHANLNCR